MTLLILEVHLPTGYIETERQLWDALVALGPRFLVYFMSFLTMGLFWNAQQVQLRRFARGDHNLTWMHIAFLVTVSVTPFSAALEENFIHFRIALLVFWMNLFLLGMTLYASWQYATAKGLLQDDVSYEVQHAIRVRLVLAQTLYTVGFALCVFSTLWSITTIVLVQVGLAVAPTKRWFKRPGPLRGGGH